MKATNKTMSLKTVLGPLWNIYTESSVSDIMIDSYEDIYYSQRGVIKSAVSLKSKTALTILAKNLIAFGEKQITKDETFYQIQLDEYGTADILLPPTSLKGPSIVISKIPNQRVTFDDLIKYEALDLEGKEWLEKIILSKKGFLVSGTTGSGKTTLLNTLIESIPESNRIVTLEYGRNLVIRRQRVCRLQSEHHGKDALVKLVQVAEHMKGDYTILAHSIGPELSPFIEIVRSCSTGVALMSGDNPIDVIKRLATKIVISSEGFSLEEANYSIAQAFPYLIFQERRIDGKRVLSSISETNYKDGVLALKPLYKR